MTVTAPGKETRVVKQVNKHPQRFAEPRPHLTISGPKISISETVTGWFVRLQSTFRKESNDLLHWPLIQLLATLEAISNDILRQTSASEYPQQFPRLRQGLFSTSMGQTSVTVANNQPTNVVFLWEYSFGAFRRRTVQLRPPADLHHEEPPLPALVSTMTSICENGDVFYLSITNTWLLLKLRW